MNKKKLYVPKKHRSEEVIDFRGWAKAKLEIGHRPQIKDFTFDYIYSMIEGAYSRFRDPFASDLEPLREADELWFTLPKLFIDRGVIRDTQALGYCREKMDVYIEQALKVYRTGIETIHEQLQDVVMRDNYSATGYSRQVGAIIHDLGFLIQCVNKMTISPNRMDNTVEAAIRHELHLHMLQDEDVAVFLSTHIPKDPMKLIISERKVYDVVTDAVAKVETFIKTNVREDLICLK